MGTPCLRSLCPNKRGQPTFPQGRLPLEISATLEQTEEKRKLYTQAEANTPSRESGEGYSVRNQLHADQLTRKTIPRSKKLHNYTSKAPTPQQSGEWYARHDQLGADQSPR